MNAPEQSPLFFGPGTKKGILLLAICTVFVAIGAWMRHEQPFMGWLTVCFFGLGIPVSLSFFLPQLTYLKLDPSGFEVSTLGRKHKIAWSDICDLQLVSVHGNQMVGFNYAPNYPRIQVGRAVASALSGVEGAVQNNYKISTQQLFEVLKDWHARYGNRAN